MGLCASRKTVIQIKPDCKKRKCETSGCNFCAHSDLAGIASNALQWVKANGSATVARHCCFRCMQGLQDHGRYCQQVPFETATFAASPSCTSLVMPEKRRKVVARFAPRSFVTGGQPGADSVPFLVFKELGIQLSGFTFRTEVAARYGLQEGDQSLYDDWNFDWNEWRDKKNADIADVCLAFLTTQPYSGRGTMRTVNYFVHGVYDHVHVSKPEERDHLALEFAGSDLTGPTVFKPVIVFWDIAEAKLDEFACVLRDFLTKHRPSSLMFSGSLESTWVGTEELGAELLRRTLLLNAEAECTSSSSVEGSTRNHRAP